jgi:protein TonB
MKKILFIILFALPHLSIAQEEKPEEIQAQVLIFADQMPEFPGGIENLNKFLGNHLVYPDDLRKKNIEGKVVLKFIVDTAGNIINIESLIKAPQAFVDEAIRVVKLMPRWTPGEHNGKKAFVQYVLPVRYQLR